MLDEKTKNKYEELFYNIPIKIEDNKFKTEILDKLSTEEEKNILNEYYKESNNIFSLKNDLSKENKIKIFNIINSIGYKIQDTENEKEFTNNKMINYLNGKIKCIGSGGSGVIFEILDEGKCIKITKNGYHEKVIEHIKIIKEVYYLIKCADSNSVLPVYFFNLNDKFKKCNKKKSDELENFFLLIKYFEKITLIYEKFKLSNVEEEKCKYIKQFEDINNKIKKSNLIKKEDYLINKINQFDEKKLIEIIYSIINNKKSINSIIISLKYKCNYYSGYIMEKGYPLDHFLGYYSYLFTNLKFPDHDLDFPHEPDEWLQKIITRKYFNTKKNNTNLLTEIIFKNIIIFFIKKIKFLENFNLNKIFNFINTEEVERLIKLSTLSELKFELAKIITNIEVNKKVKREFIIKISEKLERLNNILYSIKTQKFPSQDILEKLIIDILLAQISMHKNKLIHFDIKEQNIMVIKNTDDFKFVLFDFGSVREVDEIYENIESPDEKFESTYQYLPIILQKLKPINRFTSHNKVSYSYKNLSDYYIHPSMLDLHALSQIIFNFLSDSQFKRLSSFFKDIDYEKFYSFAQLISLDFAEKDCDSVYCYVPKKIDKTEFYNFKKDIEEITVINNLDIFYNLYNNFYYLNEELDNNELIKLYYTILRLNYKLPNKNVDFNCSNIAFNLFIKSKLISELSKNEFKEIELEYNNQHPLIKINNLLKKQCFKDNKIKYSKEKCNENKNCIHLSLTYESFKKAIINKIKIFNIDFSYSSLLDCDLISHLYQLYQLSLIYLCPPKYSKEENNKCEYAKHNRLEHSIGTFIIVYIILLSLLKNSGWFNLRFKIEDGIFLLLSALLHDIGHYPCSHDLEDLNVFLKEEDISTAILKGDIKKLSVTKENELNKLYDFYNKNGINKYNKINNSEELHKKCCDFHDVAKDDPCKIRCLGINQLIEFYDKFNDIIKLYYNNFEITSLIQKFKNVKAKKTNKESKNKNFFNNINEDILKNVMFNFKINDDTWNLEDFFIWYKKFKNAQRQNELPNRLIYRILGGIISGPIDADKIHYLVNDSIFCHTSLTKSLEGEDFFKFIDNLRIPIRNLDDTKMQSLCLGVNEQLSHFAQNIMFLRGAMFKHIYWSSDSRAISVVLRFILSESFYWLNKKNKKSKIYKYCGKIYRSNDKEFKKEIKKLSKKADIIKKEYLNDSRNGECLKDMIKNLFEVNTNSINKYTELCRIYPSDTIAYRNICSFIDYIDEFNISIANEERKMIIVSYELIIKIQSIIQKILNIPKNELKYGSILLDIPMRLSKRDPAKTNEFTKFVIVDKQGYGIPFGNLWNELNDYWDESVRLIRIFIKPGIIFPDREDKYNVRKAIIEHFS